MLASQLAGTMQKYAKRYNAGAFAMPIASELKAHPERLRVWDEGAAIAYTTRLGKTSTRRDWAGRPYLLPAGSRVVTHFAHTDGATLPYFDQYDYVFTYVEDEELTRWMEHDNWVRCYTRVSSASELITCWGKRGSRVLRDEPWDAPTVKEIELPKLDKALTSMERELGRISEWKDDYPFYSDGSWGAISLRGFYPEDPTRGVKPAEMDRAWKAKHAGDLQRRCDWTRLAASMPVTRAFVESVPWWSGLERVRLLRMAGTGHGKLGRHTDITDKAGGTRDGQITRFHVPLVTDPAIKLHWWELDGTKHEHHLERGKAYYLDARKPHAVTNPTNVNRVHLVADVVSSDQVREVLAS